MLIISFALTMLIFGGKKHTLIKQDRVTMITMSGLTVPLRADMTGLLDVHQTLLHLAPAFQTPGIGGNDQTATATAKRRVLQTSSSLRTGIL